MKDETIDAEFTIALRDFLQRRGYIFIHSLGLKPNEVNDAAEPETGKENYWLQPLKSGNELLNNDTPEDTVHPIAGQKVSDMANATGEIQFMIRVPLIDYNDYLAKR